MPALILSRYLSSVTLAAPHCLSVTSLWTQEPPEFKLSLWVHHLDDLPHRRAHGWNKARTCLLYGAPQITQHIPSSMLQTSSLFIPYVILNQPNWIKKSMQKIRFCLSGWLGKDTDPQENWAAHYTAQTQPGVSGVGWLCAVVLNIWHGCCRCQGLLPQAEGFDMAERRSQSVQFEQLVWGIEVTRLTEWQTSHHAHICTADNVS